MKKSMLLLLLFASNFTHSYEKDDPFERLVTSSRTAHVLKQTFQEELDKIISIHPEKTAALRCLGNSIKEDDLVKDLAVIFRQHVTQSDALEISKLYESKVGSELASTVNRQMAGISDQNDSNKIVAFKKEFSDKKVSEAFGRLTEEISKMQPEVARIIPDKIKTSGMACRAKR